MTRWTQISSLAALAAALGCSETTLEPGDQLTFDRPVDIAFACFGGMRVTNGASATVDQPIVTTAMPPSSCDARTRPPVVLPDICQPQSPNTPRLTEPSTPPGQESIRDLSTEECKVQSASPAVGWFGLVLESGPGTVNVVSFAPSTPGGTFEPTVDDSDRLTPGKNGISVGEEPVAITVDPAGCHAITANAGSCDLSVLDLNSALDDVPGARVDRLTVKNASGAEIEARPAAMVAGPSSTDVGFTCPAAPTGLVYVAYPGCHLVAGVDPSTGTIVTGVQYDAAGTPTIVTGDVTCPAECGGGGAVTPGVRPVALDLEYDPRVGTRRLVIGADNSSRITLVELGEDNRPLSVSQIALEDPAGTLGVTAIALSPELGGGGGSFGSFDALDDNSLGGAFQFVYAVATDGTVRVADALDLRRECDTQVDPRYVRASTVRALGCFPVGEPTTPPRRAGARSPGIHLPNASIPLSVEFLQVDKTFDERRMNFDTPGTLIGHFAVVTSSNGSAFVVNVDDDDYPDQFVPQAPLSVLPPIAMAHQLRDLIGDRSLTIDTQDASYDPGNSNTSTDDVGCDSSGKFLGTEALGSPRAAAPPERRVAAGTLATEKLTQLPGIRQVLCDRRAWHGDKSNIEVDLRAVSELSYAAPDDVRARAFPDVAGVPPAENWSIVWEGSLSLNTGPSDVDGPVVREGALTVDGLGLHVLDEEESFCEAGVEPFDIVHLRGCDPARKDCPSGHTCFVHPESKLGGQGSCLPEGEASRLANACKDFLTTQRRYTVRTTRSGELIAMPRRVELRTTPLDGCVDDAQCEALADYAARAPSASHPFADTTPADPRTWGCVADPFRAPKAGTGKRCQLRCTTSADCLTGTVCQGATDQPLSGFCMEGVIPPQACINSSQRYTLHAGEAFAVIGDQSGFVHPIIEDAGGQCVRDPMANPLLAGRIPLLPRDPAAPNNVRMCDPAADPLTGRLPNGTYEPNPCLTTVPHTDVRPRYMPQDGNPCALPAHDSNDPNPYQTVELFERQAPAVLFRNRGMTFSLVDPYYPGDATCILDRQGNLGQIPHVLPGYTLAFRQVGGLVPMQLLRSSAAQDVPSFPVRAVRGPSGTLWVVDEGDFLTSNATIPSTRGKVFRVDAIAPGSAVTFK